MGCLRFQGLAGLACLAVLGGCSTDPVPQASAGFQQGAFPSWKAQDDAYRFYPGDRFRMDIRTAPELSGELTIAPDGRVALPTVGPLMAAGHTVKELQAATEAIYDNELLDPSMVITPTAFGSQKIFVGGEVKQPGVFELPGEIDPLQAVLLAGGWTDKGKPTQVIVMRRSPGGELMYRVADVRNGLAEQSLYDVGPLKRFDVVFVTRKAIVDENLFVQQFIRDALPIEFSLFYDVAQIAD
jgi:protein involved in polysaccharide export with SLBB domain